MTKMVMKQIKKLLKKNVIPNQQINITVKLLMESIMINLATQQIKMHMKKVVKILLQKNTFMNMQEQQMLNFQHGQLGHHG